MRSRDIAKLKEDIEIGVRLAQSLGLDVSRRRAPVPSGGRDSMAGGPLAERIRAQVAEDVRELGEIGLATVQVGEDPASTIYIRRKHEAAARGGIASVDLKLPQTIPQRSSSPRSPS